MNRLSTIPLLSIVIALLSWSCERTPEIIVPSKWNNELEWTWIENEKMLSRSGTTTGYAINLNASSSNLLIYLQGGGACYNAHTCERTPESFQEDNFQRYFIEPGSRNNYGIFNRNEARNPFHDWNILFVPYSTGDVHAGRNESADVPGVSSTQMNIGYQNMQYMLEEAAPILKAKGITKVFLTGASAGGFGSIFNYDQVAQAFSGLEVIQLSDGGPILLNNEVFPFCFGQQIGDIWNIQIPPDYDQFVTTSYEFKMKGMYEYLSRKYPTAQFGLYMTYGDQNISYHYAFGQNDCANKVGSSDPVQFKTSILELADEFDRLGNWSYYMHKGTSHTTYYSGQYETLMINGVSYTDWIGQLIDHSPINVKE